jgi:D-alanine-D-alanine ligase
MKKILIVTDTQSEDGTEDAQDTMVQVSSINDALISSGYQTNIIYFDQNLKLLSNEIKKFSPDIIFNLVEDENDIYYPPIVSENLDIKYTGADAGLILLTHNKIKLKKFLNNFKNSFFEIPSHIHLKENNLRTECRKVIIKPVAKHGSFGIDSESVCENFEHDDIVKILKKKQVDEGIEFFAEEYIEGREFNIGILNNEILPFAEIIFKDFAENKPKIIDYKAKWISDSFEFNSTPREFNFLDDNDLTKRLKAASLELIRLLNINRFIRFDFRVVNNGMPYIVDINTNPCLSYDGGFFAACKEKGLSYSDMIEMILKEAYE